MTTTFQFTTTLERPNASGSDVCDEEITVTVTATPFEEKIHRASVHGRYCGHDLDITCKHASKDSPPLSRTEWAILHDRARQRWREDSGFEDVIIDVALAKLRTHSGWWNGDRRAKEILAELLNVAREKWRNGDYRTRADVTCDDREGK